MTEMTERLKPLGEMFGLPQDFNEDTKDKVTELKISHLKDYHKGNLGENRYSKQDLEDLVESVKINGIIQPLVVRPLNENDEYEIILGHHRRDAALLAGLNTVPCLINDDLDDDTAELLFMDSNLQHGFEKMKQSEKAELIYRRNEVLKRAVATVHIVTNIREYGRKSVDEEFNLSRSSIQRYLRIYQLTDKLKEALDNGKIGVKVAVDLSFISTIYQDLIADYIKENDVKIDKKMSEKIKTVSERQHLNDKTLFEILNGKISEEVKVKPKKTSIKVSKKVLNKYFKPEQKQDEIDKIIEKALEMYYQN